MGKIKEFFRAAHEDFKKKEYSIYYCVAFGVTISVMGYVAGWKDSLKRAQTITNTLKIELHYYGDSLGVMFWPDSELFDRLKEDSVLMKSLDDLARELKDEYAKKFQKFLAS